MLLYSETLEAGTYSGELARGAGTSLLEAWQALHARARDCMHRYAQHIRYSGSSRTLQNESCLGGAM